jgi:hypothetical protein
MTASPVRYFLLVGLHASHALIALVILVVLGAWMTVTAPGELDSALGLVLFLQMFLASSGLLPPARRGHFDPVLTCATDRLRALTSHWFASILPGAVGWVVLAAIAGLVRSPSVWSAIAGRRAAAFLIVSTLAWSAGFALTRGAAGALWMAGLLATVLSRANLITPRPIGPAASWITVLHDAAVVTLCPFLLIGNHPDLASGAIACALCISAVCLLTIWRAAPALDIYLRDDA